MRKKNICCKVKEAMGLGALVALSIKHLPETQEIGVQPPGREDPLEKEMATHSSTLSWKITWTEESGRLQSTGKLLASDYLILSPDD